ncbi:MAG: threonine synthase [Rectinema subterraneum]|uniref:threonine synthase n=1 Tax=Rectinema subterraneum TaxID=2653714 RepID=UPI003C7D30F0
MKSTQSGIEYPIARLEEFAENGESLEVVIPGIEKARPKSNHGFAHSGIFERYMEFFPFSGSHPELSLGEGMTPLIDAGPLLKSWTGLDNLLLKNETVNPTWSFKDRGSLACAIMAVEQGEHLTATISTGNMGQSIAAYGARAGLKVLVFLPDFAPKEKAVAIAVHGATIMRVHGAEYADMKERVLGLAGRFGIRIVSGNGPVRVEGYKIEAFEMFEQLGGKVPDYIAVPTSACGHIRGIFKGFRELRAAGLIARLPRMIVVQAAANSPLVTAIREGRATMVPFSNFVTVAEALSSGRPPGGDEIIAKAYEYGWLAADATEEEILESQRLYARAGFFVEPASATTLAALRRLRASGRLGKEDSVIAVLTGSGMKDTAVLERHRLDIVDLEVDDIERTFEDLLDREHQRISSGEETANGNADFRFASGTPPKP